MLCFLELLPLTETRHLLRLVLMQRAQLGVQLPQLLPLDCVPPRSIHMRNPLWTCPSHQIHWVSVAVPATSAALQRLLR